MPNAGQFEILVSDPWPCWVAVSYAGQVVMRFRHDEIMDLAYCVERARQEAVRKLPTNQKDEV